MSISQNYPTIAPSLDLSFALTKKLDPRVTFARASTATYYDGKSVSLAEQNLLLQSQEFDNASWGKLNATVVANNSVAPDGTTTAELVYPTTTGTNRGIFQGSTAVYLSTAVDKAISIYAKASGISHIRFEDASNGANRTWFNVSTGTVGTTAASHTATIQHAGNGWYRCIVTTSIAWAANASVGFIISDADNSTTATTNGTDGVLIWGAQVEQRSSVTAYTPTTTQPITNYIPTLLTAPANVARFEHNPVTGESLGLLVEEQRTNLVTYSEDFSNAVWSKPAGVSVLSNTNIAPDGTLTADTITATSNQSQRSISVLNTAHSFSISILKTTNATVFPMFYVCNSTSTVGAFLFFNTNTGATSLVAPGAIGIKVTNQGSYWRLSVTAVVNDTTINILIYAAATTNMTTYSGGLTNSITVWGAQLEAGSFSTSYIPTVASQVTRAADSASMVGSNFSDWYRQDEGSFYLEHNSAKPSGNGYGAFVISNNTPDSRIMHVAHVSGTNQGFYGPNVAITYLNSVTVGAYIKSSMGYKFNDYGASGNGLTTLTDTSNTVPLVNRLDFGHFFPGNPGSNTINGTIKKLSYYPLRLTNAQLQALTS